MRGRPDRIEPDESGTEHGRGVEPDEDGSGCCGVHSVSDAVEEGGIAGVEHAPAEHHLDDLVLQVEPDDGGADEGHDLVGQGVGRLAGHGVAGSRGVESTRASSKRRG